MSIDLVGEIGKELIGSETAARGRRRSGVLRDGFGLRRRDWSLGWLLIVSRNERLGVQHKLIFLRELEFIRTRLTRLLRNRGSWNFLLFFRGGSACLYLGRRNRLQRDRWGLW